VLYDNDGDNAFLVTKPDGTTFRFVQSKMGLYYLAHTSAATFFMTATTSKDTYTAQDQIQSPHFGQKQRMQNGIQKLTILGLLLLAKFSTYLVPPLLALKSYSQDSSQIVQSPKLTFWLQKIFLALSSQYLKVKLHTSSHVT
jgi:hypothetical protein